MGIKSNIINVTYAGRVLFSRGDRLNADNYRITRKYSTSGEPIINAQSPEIVNNGNSEGSFSLPLLKDFKSEPEALAFVVELEQFLSEHLTGELLFSVGSNSIKWTAGVTNFDATTSYFGSGTGSRVRVQVTVEFILGAQA